MASPTVNGRNNGVGESAASTSHTANLPASIAAGDLLLVFVYAGANPGAISASGFTFLASDGDDTHRWLALGYKNASGSEGGTLTVTTANSVKCAFTSYRISGWSGTPEKATAATGSGSNADPPSLTPAGGSKDYLWIAAMSYNIATVPSAAPTNYLNGRTNATSGAGGQNGAIGTAERQLTASSEDPGTFTNTTAGSQWVAQTFAISPTAVGGGAKSSGYIFG